MNYVKIVSKGWAGYTGQLNVISFRNGISTEPVPNGILDRIAAVTQLVACDAEGNEVGEGEHLGIQNRMIGGVTMRAPVAVALSRQTDEEKALEGVLDASKVLKAPVEKLYSREELEAIADKAGLKGLREIGDKWKVRSKSIGDLIARILTVQDKFTKQRAALAEKTPTTLRTHTLPAEEEAAVDAVPEEALVPAGNPLLAAEYYVDDAVIPAETIINSALKNSGKSLSGWNALSDADRLEHLLAEIYALEQHFGKKLTDVAPHEEVKTDAPADDADAADGTSADAVDGEGEGDASESGADKGEEGPEQPGSDEEPAPESDESKDAE
jgi:hypothetical protein